MIITVDIGGTKTLCALWDKGSLLKKEQRDTSSIKDYIPLIRNYAQENPIDALCFALAGPITGNRLELTNQNQILDLDRIRQSFPHIPRVAFLNDLEALGYAIDILPRKSLSIFRKGTGQKGAKAILSIGTGLGISAVTTEGAVLPSEGGHVDFAPCDPQQKQILRHLENKYGHVSYERLLSGQGLVNLYEALTGNPHLTPAQITKQAFAKEEEALETMAVFTRILAAACGNAAMTFLARGGVYLGGGIIPKILPLLDRNLFEEAFLFKGRFHHWLEAVPVYAILDEMAPSIGAARFGAESPPRI